MELTLTYQLERYLQDQELAERLIKQPLKPLVKLLSTLLTRNLCFKGRLFKGYSLGIADRYIYHNLGGDPIYLGEPQHELTVMRMNEDIIRFRILPNGTPTSINPRLPAVAIISLVYDLYQDTLVENALPQIKWYQQEAQETRDALEAIEYKLEQAWAKLSPLKAIYYKLQD